MITVRPLHQPLQCLDDVSLGFAVERRRRLIQNEYRGIADDGARDPDALPLTARECQTAIAHRGVVSLRHLVDEFVRVGQYRRPDNLIPRGARVSIRDVLGDRPAEQYGILQARIRYAGEVPPA